MITHMKSMHYYTCIGCGFYFHSKKLYKQHEAFCTNQGQTDGKTNAQRRDDLTLILTKLATTQETLAATQDQMGRYNAQGDQWIN